MHAPPPRYPSKYTSSVPPPPPSREESEKAFDAWFRPLKGDRLEVLLKTPNLRLRVSGKADDVWAVVEVYEELTGRRVEGDWKRPPRRGPRVPANQESLDLSPIGPTGEGDEDEPN